MGEVQDSTGEHAWQRRSEATANARLESNAGGGDGPVGCPIWSGWLRGGCIGGPGPTPRPRGGGYGHRVTSGPLQVTIDAEGKTRVDQRYVVAAPVTGRLQRIELEAGDAVTAGAVVAQIDPLPLNSQVRAAQARLRELQAQIRGVDTQRPKPEALAQAQARLQAATATREAAAAEAERLRADLEQARRDRTRAQTLEAQGAISRQEREAAELEATRLSQELAAAQRQLDGATAEVTAARATLPLLRAEQRDPDYLIDVYRAQMAAVEAELANLADEARRTTIMAPVAGKVLRVPEASARVVQEGEPLLELGNPAELELVIDVLSADAVRITPGDPILVKQWGGDDVLRARVSAIEPAAFTEVSALGVEEQRVNVIGQFDRPAAVSLGDGYRIEAGIVVWAAEEVLQVPVSALYRCGQHWCVFVVDNGRTDPRQISIGQRTPTAAVVTAGLQPGDRVILHPSDQIEAGQPVQPR
ncbi:Multidrug efflux pump subunit [Halomicronema hongdechloris C2206]|uniref:Multidrug efflux pump subunit n=1 Tax=Halomicronema hongdechloris C2206 TaxID=1641165 RepID=A0A1Z3HNJ1_9CYAN|nr:HlyD family efflux transporter periplasmic adaptor subunit [Halomicronema hongdechloris]ASC71845.1 Multidrug efflux pump subunit [Halomicronema hongdechloris C2206]